MSEVEFITSVKYNESVWMNYIGAWGEGKVSLVYRLCIHMPTDSFSVAVVDSCYHVLLQYWALERRGQLYYNARVGRAVIVDDAVAIYGHMHVMLVDFLFE